MCRAAANGRAGNSPTQGYNNCGVEVSRQIANQVNGANLTENGFLQNAINNGWATGTPGGSLSVPDGLTFPFQRQQILANQGIPTSQLAPTMGNMELPLSQGRALSVDVWQGNMPAPPYPGGMVPNTGGHNVLVTGAVYDDNGNLTEVIINDTATGQCGQHVQAGTFQNALIGGGNNHVVTNNPIF
jgi:hypothetical protein